MPVDYYEISLVTSSIFYLSAPVIWKGYGVLCVSTFIEVSTRVRVYASKHLYSWEKITN